jgi:SAM-dependent methyltransferase
VSPAPIDWDDAWASAWKASARNPWFGYQADVYAGWLDGAGARLLKTDGFDEACGFRPVDAPGGLFLMDVSPRVLAEARRHRSGVLAVACDVRRLAVRSQAFDLVFSPSTLDHFDDERDIETALAELGRILRPGGLLLITLDNPANPILRVRAALHRRTGPVGGLIPFPMGRTLSRPRLAAALARAGFALEESGYAVHMPRIVGLWLGEWAARRGALRTAARLRRLFLRIDRLAARLPTRRLSAHFVVARGRRAEGPGAVTAPPARGGLMTAVGAFRDVEQRARTAYLRLTPVAVVGATDPPLRAAAAIARRAAAVPIYLDQRLALWTGPCGAQPAHVAGWGKADAPRRLFDIVFDAPPAKTPHGRRSLRQVLRTPAAGADLLVAETTPALAPFFRRRGFLLVPDSIRFAAPTTDVLAAVAAPGRSLRSDLKLVRTLGWRHEVRPYSRELAQRFHAHYCLPHALARYEEEARVPSLAWIERQMAAGVVLVLGRPERPEPCVMGIVVRRGPLLWMSNLGTRGGDPEVLRAGGLAALYLAFAELGRDRGVARLDVGRCSPWRTDGTVRFKWKWGYRPVVDGAQTLEYAVRVLRPASAAAARLREHGVFVRTGRRFRILGPDGALIDA